MTISKTCATVCRVGYQAANLMGDILAESVYNMGQKSGIDSTLKLTKMGCFALTAFTQVIWSNRILTGAVAVVSCVMHEKISRHFEEAQSNEFWSLHPREYLKEPEDVVDVLGKKMWKSIMQDPYCPDTHSVNERKILSNNWLEIQQILRENCKEYLVFLKDGCKTRFQEKTFSQDKEKLEKQLKMVNFFMMAVGLSSVMTLNESIQADLLEQAGMDSLNNTRRSKDEMKRFMNNGAGGPTVADSDDAVEDKRLDLRKIAKRKGSLLSRDLGIYALTESEKKMRNRMMDIVNSVLSQVFDGSGDFLDIQFPAPTK